MWRLFTLLVLLFPLLLPHLAQAGEAREYWHAEFILKDTATPPDAADPGWHGVQLPHALRGEAPLAGGGWFRFRIHTDAIPGEPQGIYVWWLNLNAAFYFNGEFLGDGGQFQEPIARNWNRSFLYLLPRSLWRTGENTLLVRLRSDPGWGILSPIEVGDYARLRHDHERRHLLQVEITQALTITLLVATTLVLAVWWRRRHEPQYFWFGLACLMWAIFSAYLVVRDPPMPGPLFRWLSHLALDAWVVCMVLFVHRYLGLARPRQERLLAFFPVLAGLLTATPMLWQGHAFLVTHLITFSLILWMTLLVGRHWWRSRWRESGLLLASLATLVLAAIHDLLVSVPWYWLPDDLAHLVLKHHFILFNFAVPAVLLFLTGHLGRRFADALTHSEVLNRELESRVAASHQALSESFAQRGKLERETARAEERERIYRDLHDDIGAKLLSLAIRAPDPQGADIARSALQDLRDVVSRSAQTEAQLTDLLADWRAEAETRCKSARLRLAWNQPDDLPDGTVSAVDALHLGRILREALSNVLRHAQADSVAVDIRFTQGGYRIAIQDDGGGKPRAPGRGMRNMQTRAAHLGGSIEWIWDAGGCRVELTLPTAFAAAPQNGSVSVR